MQDRCDRARLGARDPYAILLWLGARPDVTDRLRERHAPGGDGAGKGAVGAVVVEHHSRFGHPLRPAATSRFGSSGWHRTTRPPSVAPLAFPLEDDGGDHRPLTDG